MALRRERVDPARLRQPVPRAARQRQARPRPGAELCRANDSPVARVFAMVVGYWGQPAATIRQAIGYDAAGEVADLKRNVRVLNGTATLAPLLGLLGTVIGMIQSFDALGGRVGPRQGRGAGAGDQPGPGDHRASGWRIAIVSVTAYYYLLNRVDVLVRELDEQRAAGHRPGLPARRSGRRRRPTADARPGLGRARHPARDRRHG